MEFDFTDKRLISETILSDVAEAIREKTGLEDKLKPSEFAEYILLIDGSKVYRYRDSWRGIISPMDGTFQQAYYNNGIAVGGKIYFNRNYGHSHYDGDNILVGCWFCYDTTNNTITRTELLCDDEPFYCTAMWQGDDGAIYGHSRPYRYKSTDYGVTWTREEMTSPSYEPCPVYKLSNGRIIGTILNRTKYLMISDDDGLTWTTITPFADEVFTELGLTSGTISMSHGTICELDDCIALYFNSPMEDYDNPNTSKRFVSLSYDNGDTWSIPVACSGDLANAGWYISPGGMVYYGNKYHYFVSNRYRAVAYSEDENYCLIGELKWYIGTAEDVKNGTMTLKKVLSQTLCNNSPNFDMSMAAQDVGNGGVTLCNGALYVNYGNLVYNKDDAARHYVSNSGIEMFRIAFEEEEDVEPYWDTDFAAKYEEMLSAANTGYNYYFYSPSNTNINAVDWWGYDSVGYLPNEGTFKLPLGTGDFEINGILNCSYNSIVSVDGGSTYPKIFAGVEETDGTLHAIGGHRINQFAIFDKANDGVPSGVLAGGDKTYFTFKRENGVDTYTINGVTVTDPPFGWTFGTDGVLLGVTEPSFVYNINATDDVVQAWLDTSPAYFNIHGFSMLTVFCDANYQGTQKDHSVIYNLNGCTSSNTATGVNDGKAFETTISVNDGYELESIVCTMGGVAQTVTDGVISIESVTGDIVITATANAIVKDHSVTYNLTGCVSSNTTPSLDDGEAYSTTITAISGYELESVTCTMGGVEQTVTNGTISIESVTGGIVVTAVAVELSADGLPTGYTRVSYIDNGSRAYIDTGMDFSFTDNDEFYLKFAITKTDVTQIAFGYGASTNQLVIVNGKFRCDQAVGSGDGPATQNSIVVNGVYEYSVIGNQIAIDGETFTRKDTITTGGSVYLFGKNIGSGSVGNKAYMRLYEMYHKTDGELDMHLVPVLDASGVPCVYDYVSGQTLYAVTGSFTYA